MKFAHFSHVWAKAGLSPAARYEQLWRELELCDELGFDYGFCVEHHFRPDESLMSAPQLYTIAAGARTKRIRLGGMGHHAGAAASVAGDFRRRRGAHPGRISRRPTH